MVKQKTDSSIPEIDRETLFEYINTKDFLAVMFCKVFLIIYYLEVSQQFSFSISEVVEEDHEAFKILRHLELIDDEAAEYGITIAKCNDKLMAKKYGYRNPPGLTYFRKGKPINYDGDLDDEEELLDWLTNPENMEMTDHIEQVNRKMFQKIRQNSEYVAVFFCE